MNKTVKTFEGELELGHLDMLVAASARDMWVEELQELAETDERIVFVTADGGYAGKENEFRLKHPDRMLPVGIAEMDQVGIASGLALCGKIPYINGFGPFLALRTLDQVHTNVCYPNLPVRIVNTHSGLTSASGPTHYNIMDIAIMRTLPNTTVMEAIRLLKANRNITVLSSSTEIFREMTGSEIHILSTGGVFNEDSLSLQGNLAKENIRRYHVDLALLSCKGLDMDKGIMDSSEREADVKTEMVKQALEVALLADHTKFERTAFVQFLDWDKVTYLVTDERPSDQWVEFCKEKGITLIY